MAAYCVGTQEYIHTCRRGVACVCWAHSAVRGCYRLYCTVRGKNKKFLPNDFVIKIQRPSYTGSVKKVEDHRPISENQTVIVSLISW